MNAMALLRDLGIFLKTEKFDVQFVEVYVKKKPNFLPL